MGLGGAVRHHHLPARPDDSRQVAGLEPLRPRHLPRRRPDLHGIGLAVDRPRAEAARALLKLLLVSLILSLLAAMPVLALTEQDRALIDATARNDIETARRLIAAGANVNAQNENRDSAFLLAGAEGRLEILKLTLAAGADLKSTNRYGGTA